MIEVGNLLEDPALMSKKQESNITVIVAGSKFCIVPSLWKKVQALPWLTDVKGFPQLVHANPDVFELLLQFFLFGSLPCGLPRQDASELMELALPLSNVKTLIDHLKASTTTPRGAQALGANITSAGKSKMTTASFLGKISLKKMRKQISDRKLKYIADTIYPFAANKDNATIDVDYLPNLECTGSSDTDDTGTVSNNTSTSRSESSSIISSNMESNKNKRTIQLKNQRRRSAGTLSPSSIFGGMKKNLLEKRRWSSSSERKLTHEEWCASDYVL